MTDDISNTDAAEDVDLQDLMPLIRQRVARMHTPESAPDLAERLRQMVVTPIEEGRDE